MPVVTLFIPVRSRFVSFDSISRMYAAYIRSTNKRPYRVWIGWHTSCLRFVRQRQRTQEQLAHSVPGKTGTDETNGESASRATRAKVRDVTALVRPTGEEREARDHKLGDSRE